MALYSHGITLKQLLEDPTLLNLPAPKPVSGKITNYCNNNNLKNMTCKNFTN